MTMYDDGGSVVLAGVSQPNLLTGLCAFWAPFQISVSSLVSSRRSTLKHRGDANIGDLERMVWEGCVSVAKQAVACDLQHRS